jgi:hypothetical protein
MSQLTPRNQSSLEAYFKTREVLAFTNLDLPELMASMKELAIVHRSWSNKHILNELIEDGWLRKIPLTSDLYDTKTRFASRNATIFQVALSLKRNSYLSHASACYLNSLTDEAPDTVYVNKEQSPKRTIGSSMSQEGIDRAFERTPRTSNYRFWDMGNNPNPVQFVILNGKNTGDLGVELINHPQAGRIRVSNLERTLIDVTVRPQYSGGLRSVLRAYEKALPKVNVDGMVEDLKTLKYSYPYHQAIGFLMTRAGFDPGKCAPLKQLGLQFRFHLDYKMDKVLHDPEWNIYYPEVFL